MVDVLERVADEIGVRNPDHLIFFISRRAQGVHRSTISEELPRSERTLYNWNQKFEELDRDVRTRAIIQAIIEEEDLELEGIK